MDTSHAQPCRNGVQTRPTENNLRFTLAREPGNAAARAMLPQVAGHAPASAVTTLADEKRINTFMRLDSPGAGRVCHNAQL